MLEAAQDSLLTRDLMGRGRGERTGREDAQVRIEEVTVDDQPVETCLAEGRGGEVEEGGHTVLEVENVGEGDLMVVVVQALPHRTDDDLLEHTVTRIQMEVADDTEVVHEVQALVEETAGQLLVLLVMAIEEDHLAKLDNEAAEDHPDEGANVVVHR